jgi:hypothetical protein
MVMGDRQDARPVLDQFHQLHAAPLTTIAVISFFSTP